MRISQTRLRTLHVVFWTLIMVFLNYNLYRKYQSIAVCQSQHARLDALEAQIDSTKR